MHNTTKGGFQPGQVLNEEPKSDDTSVSQTIAKPHVSGSTIRTKYRWSYRYVPDGQIEPDKNGRWAIDCYIMVHTKALPKYKWFRDATGKAYMPVRIATMFQKWSTVGSVPSVVNKFCVTMPTFEDAGNTGFATQRNFFANDIEELKSIVESEFDNLRRVFRYCR